MTYEAKNEELESILAKTSLAIHRIIEGSKKVDYWTDDDAQKSTEGSIDAYLHDDTFKGTFNVALIPDKIEEIIKKMMQIAKERQTAKDEDTCLIKG